MRILVRLDVIRVTVTLLSLQSECVMPQTTSSTERKKAQIERARGRVSMESKRVWKNIPHWTETLITTLLGPFNVQNQMKRAQNAIAWSVD